MKFIKIFLFSFIVFFSIGFISNTASAFSVSGSAISTVGGLPLSDMVVDLKASVNDAYVTVANSDGPVTLSNNSSYTLSWSAIPTAVSCQLDYWYDITDPSIDGSVTWLKADGWANNSHDFDLVCTDKDGNIASDTVNLNYPPEVTNVISSCNTNGNLATVSWTAPSGYDTFYTRASTGGVEIGSPAQDDNKVGSSLSFGVTPSADYVFWVHTKDPSTNAYAKGVFSNTINCPAPVTPPSCTPTPIEIFDVNGNCVACPVGQKANRSTNSCITPACTPLEIVNANGNCGGCPVSQIADRSTNTCINPSCTVTQIVDTITGDCQECPPGEYADRTTNVCKVVLCGPNEIINPTTGLCSACPPGQTANKITNLCKKAFNYIEK